MEFAKSMSCFLLRSSSLCSSVVEGMVAVRKVGRGLTGGKISAVVRLQSGENCVEHHDP